MRSRLRHQTGFTIVELVVVLCIGAILSSIAMAQMRDYTRRAKVSEVIMAAGFCKNMVQNFVYAPIRVRKIGPFRFSEILSR